MGPHTMPILDLTPEMIGPEQAELAVGYIESVMVWPDDEENRRRLKMARQAVELSDLIRSLAKQDSPPASLDIADITPITDALAASPRLSDVATARDQRYERGTIAGWILWDALLDHHRGTKRGLEVIKRDISNRLLVSKHVKRLSISTINNIIWRIFRPVAHLWPAYMLRSANLRTDGQPVSRPCGPADLLRFLALAEQLRRDGETCRPRQSDLPILDPARTWKAPPTLHLPDFRIPYTGGRGPF
jgi:hypothetical protein